VIFDLDGTLVDSAPSITAALNRALEPAGFGPHPQDRVQSLIGNGVEALITRAIPADASALVPRIAAEFREIYAANPCEGTRPYDGIDELLAALAALVPLVVLTNKPTPMARCIVDGMGWATRFGDVVGDGTGHARKPHPGAALALMERYRASPATTLVVGDGLPDVAVARAVGCRVAACAWGYTPVEALRAEGPTFIVTRPDEVLPLVVDMVKGEGGVHRQRR
jgi:phosphoglycolate phosphatase